MTVSLDDLIARHSGHDGPLLPILHDVQAEFGHVSEDSIRHIATALNLTRAEVYGVVSFYHDFKASHDARPVLKLCRAEACKARGAEALVPVLEAQDRVRLETIYCLGLCAVGPAALAADHVYARLDLERLKSIVASL